MSEPKEAAKEPQAKAPEAASQSTPSTSPTLATPPTEAAKTASNGPDVHLEPGELHGVPKGMEHMLVSRSFYEAQLAEAVRAVQTRAFLNGLDVLDWAKWLIEHGAVAKQIVSLVTEWQTISQPITDRTGIKSRAIVAIKFMRLTASMTDTKLDDELVDLLDRLLNAEGGLDLITDLIFRLWPTPGVVTVKLSRPESVFGEEQLATLQTLARDRKIDWGRLITLLPEIVKVIGIFVPLG